VAAIAFEPIGQEHIGEVRDIYNDYVLNSTISFHTKELSMEEMRDSVLHPDPRFKSFVILQNDAICGYVLITRHKNKQAYDGSGEVTIYLKPECTGQGIDGLALDFIEEIAREQQFHTLVATVCVENGKSSSLFERKGYEPCAYYKEIGFKFGRRLDIRVFQKIL
jgi:L-amino acid N-acyltransferase YncA